jgi:hypothetical protein
MTVQLLIGVRARVRMFYRPSVICVTHPPGRLPDAGLGLRLPLSPTPPKGRHHAPKNGRSRK